MVKQGKFIVIDGTDGSGKGTQAAALVSRLKKEGRDVRVADFPQYGQRSATLVEEYLNGKFGSAKEVSPKQASIFYAVDRYAASKKIRDWLAEGKIVISNRYVSANMGHQTGKIKDKAERDEFLDWLHELEYTIFNIPKPHMTMLLFVPPEINQKLVDKKGHRDYVGGNKRDIHEEDLDHLKDAANAYAYVAEKYGFPIITCTKDEEMMSIEEIHELIWEKVNEII